MLPPLHGGVDGLLLLIDRGKGDLRPEVQLHGEDTLGEW